MKKILKQTGDIRLIGQADQNGIAFRVEHFKKNFRLYRSGSKAFIGNDGNIICSSWDEFSDKCKIDSTIYSLTENTGSVLACLEILFIFFSILVRDFSILFSSICLLVLALNIIEALSIFIGRILGNSEVQKFSKFLAAKNAVENAFYDLGRVPNIKEIKKYTCFSYYCKYLKLFKSSVSTFWLIHVFLHSLLVHWHVVGIIISIGFIFLLGKFNLLWQLLIISKPDKIHYKIAITALKESLKILEMDGLE